MYSTILKLLKQEAQIAAARRGHILNEWQAKGGDPYYAEADCAKCGMVVGVHARPAPNDIDISGEAIALQCKGYAQVPFEDAMNAYEEAMAAMTP